MPIGTFRPELVGVPPVEKMQRREARLRKEYLYRKSLEEKEKKQHEQKSKLKAALETSSRVPAGVSKDIANISKNMIYDDGLKGPKYSVDDEYNRASLRDPKILVTTSRDPSSRLTQFAKEIRLVFPNSQRINRGGHIIPEIVAACKKNDVTDLIILHEHRGIPDGMIVSHFPYGPTAYFSLHNVTLRHDLQGSLKGTVSEAYPHLIFSNFETKLGSRIKSILQHLFPVPKEDTKRVMTFANQSDFISFRHHTFSTAGGKEEPELEEVGPRFELRPYEVKLGTVDMDDADSEWSLRPYMNTARKRDML